MGSWCSASVNPLHSHRKKDLKRQPTKTEVQMCGDGLQEPLPTKGEESAVAMQPGTQVCSIHLLPGVLLCCKKPKSF